jgi:glycosyltransferase involved in cell wall biosynthesis
VTDPVLVTTAVTTFDRPKMAQRAIRSVLAQTYPHLEILVVEDGSCSGIEDWIASEAKARVRYCHHDSNRGLAAARNTGLRLANGQYIAYLDDDDTWKPDRIAKQVRLLMGLSAEDRARLGVVYCGVEISYPDGYAFVPNYPKNRGNLRKAIMRSGPITLSSTFLFSRDALLEVGGFDERIVSSVDHDIWMALAAADYDVHVVDEPLVVTYEGPSRLRMITNTSKRIAGVQAFVDKWMPTYQAWMGERDGIAFARRYYTRVIGHLAAQQLVLGRLRDAMLAVRAGLLHRCASWQAPFVMAKYVALFAGRRFLPVSITSRLVKAWAGRHRRHTP